MKKRVFSFGLAIIIFVLCVILVSALTKPEIPSDFEGKIKTYARNKPNMELSVAVIDSNGVSISKYGRMGKSVDPTDKVYEIGDITKTFTGAMIAQSVAENEIGLQDKISDHMVINNGTYTPSVFELVTHTSAYGNYPGYSKIKYNSGQNPYYKTDYPKVITLMDDFRLNQNPPYMYSYSDFGAAVLGMLLEDTYGSTYTELLNDFVQSLGLENTYVAFDKSSMPENGWKWNSDDAYIASLGLSSTIYDMSEYAQKYLNNDNAALNYATTPLIEINMENYVAFMWNVTYDGIVRHGGSTSNYSSEIMIDKANNKAVVVLSNYSDDKFGSVEDIAMSLIEN